MKTLTMIFWGLLAFHAAAREQWHVDRFAECGVRNADRGMAEVAARGLSLKTEPLKAKNFSLLPSITPGWPLRGGKWLIQWKGTF
jgi:hypothetical protein